MTLISYQTNDHTTRLLEDWWENQFHSPFPDSVSVGYVDTALQLAARNPRYYTFAFLPPGFQEPHGANLLPLNSQDGTPLRRGTYFVYRQEEPSPEIAEFVYFVKTAQI